EASSAHAHLLGGLFAADIKDARRLARVCRPVPAADAAGHLQQQRALADAGVPPDEHGRTGNETAAEDAVQLADVRRDALKVRARLTDARDRKGHGLGIAAGGLIALLQRRPRLHDAALGVGPRGSGLALDRLLLERIPRAAVRALA